MTSPLPGTPPAGTPPAGPTRRTVLLGGGAIGAAGVLAACGPSPGGPAGGGPADSSGPLVKTADVPVGNGVILRARKVVVVQPTAGTFKAYSAVCTHQFCTVASIKDGVIFCPCHGGTYSAKDGSVTGGPAPRPLTPIPVTVQGDEVVGS